MHHKHRIFFMHHKLRVMFMYHKHSPTFSAITEQNICTSNTILHVPQAHYLTGSTDRYSCTTNNEPLSPLHIPRTHTNLHCTKSTHQHPFPTNTVHVPKVQTNLHVPQTQTNSHDSCVCAAWLLLNVSPYLHLMSLLLL